MSGTQPGQMYSRVHALRRPNDPAVILAETGEMLSWSGYEVLSNQFAHLLRKLDVDLGERVAFLAENHLQYIPLAWGALRCGARIVPISTHLGTAELTYILADSRAKVLIVSPRQGATLAGLDWAETAVRHKFAVLGALEGFDSLDEALSSCPAIPVDGEVEGVDMVYSSGTTGRPKGVLKPLPETPFGVPAPALLATMARYGIDERTIYLSPAPLYHAAPLLYNLRINRVGGTSVVMARFDAHNALRFIERYAVTHAQWVPTMFVRLLRLPTALRERYDLRSLVCAIHAAAPCPVEIKRQMIDWWGPIIWEYYGGSEGNGLTGVSSDEWLARPGTVGRALLGDVRICDEAGNVLPAGEVGTVFFAGGPVFEYHNDPAKTRGSRNRHGWSTLGDVGYLDEDGYLYLTDRESHMIISGGVNIYPQETENLLQSHPEVVDAAVFGVPNDEYGEEVKAVVTLVDSSKAGVGLEADLIAFCRATLSHIKCPRSIDFSEQLPRLDNGKLYKRVLRDDYARRARQ